MENGRAHNESDVACRDGTPSVVRGDFAYLIAEARSGSELALGRILDGCRNYLLRSAQRALDSDLRPKGGASDFVQDTFLEAHTDFAAFRGSTERELLAWLTTILNHRLSNNRRRFRSTLKRDVDREIPLEALVPPACADTENGAAEKNLVAGEDAQRLREALDRLPPTMRTVLTLRTWERRTFVEIATTMHGSPESVRKLWVRAVQRLRTEFKQQP